MPPRNPKGVRPLVKNERAYERDLRRTFLNPIFATLRARLDAVTSTTEAYAALNALMAEIAARPNGGVPVQVVDAAMRRLDVHHRRRLLRTFRSALGVDVSVFLTEPATNALIVQRIGENVDLIKTIPPRMQTGLRARMVETFADAPFDRQAMTGVLRDEFKSSGYNLRRIARDQSNKLVGQLTEHRQRQLGIDAYEWGTSQDERVRPTHAANDGEVFKWGEPPSTGPPGFEIQCRCIALPQVTVSDRQRLGATR